MAFTVRAKGKRFPLGERWIRRFTIDEVDNTGSSVDLTGFGVHFIESIVAAQDIEAATAVVVCKNSLTNSPTEDDPGKLFVQTASGTDDVDITLIYR